MSHDQMHMLTKATGDEIKSVEGTERFSEEELAAADRVEVWGTLFSHPQEYVLIELYDAKGNPIATKKIQGY